MQNGPATPGAVAWYYQKWFVVLMMLAFWPVGLVFLWRSPVTKRTGRLLWSAFAAMVLGIWINGGGGEVEPAPFPSIDQLKERFAAAKPAPAAQPKPAEPEPEVLTEETVRDMVDMKLTEVKILGEPGDWFVAVSFPLDPIWDEDDGLDKAADLSLRVFEDLFTSHPGITTVDAYAQGEVFDQYGNSRMINAVRITWKRATAEQVNWKNLRSIVAGQPERVYLLAESYGFRPELYQGIRNKRGLSRIGGTQ